MTYFKSDHFNEGGSPSVAGAQWRAMTPSGLHCKLVLDRRNVGECRQSGFIAKMLHLVRGSSLRKTQMYSQFLAGLAR